MKSGLDGPRNAARQRPADIWYFPPGRPGQKPVHRAAGRGRRGGDGHLGTASGTGSCKLTSITTIRPAFAFLVC